MPCELVVIGTSAGGHRALGTLLSQLSKDFPLPVVIVQHLSPDGGEGYGALLQRSSRLSVKEVEDKDVLMPGRVYLAPANYHLLVEKGSLALSIDPPVQHARPSIDVLFESAADAYGEGVVGVILTGASEDGAEGVARIKELGGLVVVQDPTTAESPMMPKAAIATGSADWILPLEDIAAMLTGLATGGCRAPKANKKGRGKGVRG